MPSKRAFWRRQWRFVKLRTLWWPTWLGYICIALFLAVPIVWWCCYGESVLAVTERRAADVLVVEGWIGPEAIRAAAAEFLQHGYKYVVASGGLTTAERWEEGGWSYAEGAQHELIKSGVPAAQIIVATAKEAERQRTFESAIAVAQTLEARGIHPRAINVFTWGPHARRSRLVFARVFQPDVDVGVLSWTPAAYTTRPWWRSSDRAKELLTESAGFLYEAFFNSGRPSNSRPKGYFRASEVRAPATNLGFMGFGERSRFGVLT